MVSRPANESEARDLNEHGVPLESALEGKFPMNHVKEEINDEWLFAERRGRCAASRLVIRPCHGTHLRI